LKFTESSEFIVIHRLAGDYSLCTRVPKHTIKGVLSRNFQVALLFSKNLKYFKFDQTIAS